MDQSCLTLKPYQATDGSDTTICCTACVQEVYLLKRHPDSMVVEDSWHSEGPFDGNTLATPPVWAGTWLIDVLVCIHDSDDGRSFWLKAMHRNVPAAALAE